MWLRPEAMTRRQLLAAAGNGFGGLALAAWFSGQVQAEQGRQAGDGLHHPARVRRVIQRFMNG